MTLKRLFGNVVLVLALCLAGYLLYRVFRQYSFSEIIQSLRSIPISRFCLALVFAAASYVCLTLFDFLAIRSLGKRLAYRKVALASFVSLSLGHNIGFAGLSSGAFRYRYYTRWGLSLEDVAKIILFCGITVGLGLITLGGLALLINPEDAIHILGLNRNLVFMGGIAALAIPVVYAVMSIFIRGRLRLWRWTFQMPILWIAVGQVLVGTVNFMLVSACLHQLLSAAGSIGYFRSVTAFVLANSAILATHVPGGLGVLEATVFYVLPEAASIGALIAFRCVYFFIPLLMGISLLLIGELILRLSSGSAKDEVETEDSETQRA